MLSHWPGVVNKLYGVRVNVMMDPEGQNSGCQLTMDPKAGDKSGAFPWISYLCTLRYFDMIHTIKELTLQWEKLI